MRSISSEQRGVNSLGLIIARLPAAKIPASGVKVRLNRKIPRADDADHALGLIFDVGRAPNRPSMRGCDLALLALHPCLEMRLGVFQRADGAGHIREQRRVDRAVAEILAQRIGDGILVADQRARWRGRAIRCASRRWAGRPSDGPGVWQLENAAHPRVSRASSDIAFTDIGLASAALILKSPFRRRDRNGAPPSFAE